MNVRKYLITLTALVGCLAGCTKHKTTESLNVEKKGIVMVEMQTSLGKITLQLDGDKAPLSVENFREYARSGFYDGTIFHRVINGFMIQGGGFDQNMNQKQTRSP